MASDNDNFGSETDFLMKKAADLIVGQCKAEPAKCSLMLGGACPLLSSLMGSYAEKRQVKVVG